MLVVALAVEVEGAGDDIDTALFMIGRQIEPRAGSKLDIGVENLRQRLHRRARAKASPIMTRIFCPSRVTSGSDDAG